MADKINELIEQARASENDSSIIYDERLFETEQQCSRFFDVVKIRMFDIRQWDRRSTPSAYALFDENGNQIDDQPIDVGRFIRISIYGTGKSDWVRVRNIHQVPNELVITVEPTFDPTEKPQNEAVISHFFLPVARNNFCVKREIRALTFFVIGLNEKQNTQFTDGLLETIRNVAAANLGTYLGMQKAYWQEICRNMLSESSERSA
jgi:hypothetical protein